MWPGRVLWLIMSAEVVHREAVATGRPRHAVATGAAGIDNVHANAGSPTFRLVGKEEHERQRAPSAHVHGDARHVQQEREREHRERATREIRHGPRCRISSDRSRARRPAPASPPPAPGTTPGPDGRPAPRRDPEGGVRRSPPGGSPCRRASRSWCPGTASTTTTPPPTTRTCTCRSGVRASPSRPARLCLGRGTAALLASRDGSG